jgi:deoxyribonuclease V
MNPDARDAAGWPSEAADLETLQQRLAALDPPRARFDVSPPLRIAACYVCFGRGGAGAGSPGDAGWAGAALFEAARCVAVRTAHGIAAAGYEPGLLARREGPLLEAAVRALPVAADVLLVDATGRDHPRGAGLALHLGARLEMPTVGATNRLLAATGDWPEDRAGASSPFILGGAIAGYWVRTRAGVRPVAAHAAWRTDARTALEIVLGSAERARTPEPLRVARRAAREARDQEARASRQQG